MKKQIKKLYLQRKKRSLKKIIGSFEKPRLSVFRSHKHIYAQLINDTNGTTLASCSTIDKNLSVSVEKSGTQEAAFLIGCELAKRALEKQITTIIFDRGNRPYQGRIKKLAEGARQEGLIF